MTPNDINALWRALTKLYPASTLAIDLFLSPSTWRLLGADLAPSIVKDRRARKAAALLAAAPAEATPIMAEMARINAWRTADLFRTVAVAYITLPIALAALLSDAAPDLVRAAVVNNLATAAYWIVALALTPIVYFCGMWRAKQLQWAIEYYKTGAVEPWPAPAPRAARAHA